MTAEVKLPTVIITLDCPRFGAGGCEARFKTEPYYDHRAVEAPTQQRITGIFCGCEWAVALVSHHG